MTEEYKSHWAADLFPLMEGEELAALVADIKTHGLRERIVRMADGDGGWLILDGRNRLRACEATGVAPSFTEYEGDDPLGAVLSANLHRRHLNESQRALAAAKLQNCANLRKKISQDEAAKMFNVSRRLVTDAAKILQKGTAFMLTEIEAGRMAVTFAVTEIKDPARSAANYPKKAAEDQTIHRIHAEDADDTDSGEGTNETITDVADEPLEPPVGAVANVTAPVEPAPTPRNENPAKSKNARAHPKNAQHQRDGKANECQLDNDADHNADALRAELIRVNAQLDRVNAELARVKDQLELYQNDGIVLDSTADAAAIAQTIRTALGDKKADVLGEVLLGRLDRQFPPDQEAAE